MINKIMRKDVGEDLWEILLEDFVDFTQDEHHKGPCRYVTQHFIINEDITDNKDLWGDWEGTPVVWSEEYGFDSDPTTLFRVEKKEIVTRKWVRVK